MELRQRVGGEACNEWNLCVCVCVCVHLGLLGIYLPVSISPVLN